MSTNVLAEIACPRSLGASTPRRQTSMRALLQKEQSTRVQNPERTSRAMQETYGQWSHDPSEVLCKILRSSPDSTASTGAHD